jgi:hypothetical protein
VLFAVHSDDPGGALSTGARVGLAGRAWRVQGGSSHPHLFSGVIVQAPLHPSDGVVISGALQIAPHLSRDAMDLLQAIAAASLRSAVDDTPSALVDQLAPGHPDGPSPWVSCPEGCCLDMNDDTYIRIDAIEPWLSYLVGTLLVDHSFSGALMLWDCAERTFSALVVDGTRVCRKPVLRRRDRTGGRRARALQPVESV